MKDKDSQLIWESLQPVAEADTEDPRYAQLIQYFMQSDGASRQEAMKMAKDTIRQMNAKGLKVVHTEPKMKREQYTSPGRVGGGNIPFPDSKGKLAQNKIMQQDLEDEERENSGYTDTGFEELQHDLKDAMSKALKIDAVLPNEKKDDDYAEVHHNLMTALKSFIEEIDIKINN